MITRTQGTSLSAAALVGLLVAWESFAPVATIPVPGDVPTVAFGHTGPDVALGSKVTVERGMVLLLKDANEAEAIVKRCAPVPMYQWEFDAYVSLAFNIGPGHRGKDGFCLNKDGMRAIIPRKLLAGDYAGGCAAILLYDKFQGKPLRGLTRRRQAEFATCSQKPEAAPP